MPEPAVTVLLEKAQAGDRGSAEALLPLVYDQLRRIAQVQMNGERTGHTLDATALVHEAYMRLVGDQPMGWGGRAHFFHAAAEAMRRILVEHARARARLKRGGNAQGRPARRLPLDVIDLAASEDPEQIVAVDEAIRRLEAQDPGAAAIVRLRFYAGLSVEDVAQALGTSPRTIAREWAYAKAVLYKDLSAQMEDDQPPPAP